MKPKPLFLVVEDNPDHRFLLEWSYQKSNQTCNILFAEDGLQALELLESSPVKPALLLLDYELPRMNGLELVMTLKASPKWKHLPIVMMSSSDDPHIVNKAYFNGASSFLEKPQSYQDFKNVWSLVFDFWSLTARLP